MILSAILALYLSPFAQVYTCSLLAKQFCIMKGTQQGCPLSPTIFNLTLILNLDINQPLVSLVKQKLIYTWADKGISYLAIHITLTSTSLVEPNYKPFLAKIEGELNQLAYVELS